MTVTSIVKCLGRIADPRISGELTKKLATGFSLSRSISCKQFRSHHGADLLLLTYIGYGVTHCRRVGTWPYAGPTELRNTIGKTSWNSFERLLLEGGNRKGTTPTTMESTTFAN